jgi:hypothetical protein
MLVAATNGQLDLTGVGPGGTEKLWLLTARPIAAMASAVRGMSVVCHKEGTGPCRRDAHHGQRLHQRRRTGPPRRP